MNGVIITEKNFNRIAADMIKFFDGADVIEWHSFDCGMKRHIPTEFSIGNQQRMRCVLRYKDVTARVKDSRGKSILPSDLTVIVAGLSLLEI